MKLSSDFADMLRALSERNVRFLIVGAYAVAQYAKPRYTKDIDIWVDPTPENAASVYAALADFGAPLDDLSLADLSTPDVVFQIGIEPVRIDVLTTLGELSFHAAFQRAAVASFAGVPVRILALDDLIAAKTNTGRPQDALDVEQLTAARARKLR